MAVDEQAEVLGTFHGSDEFPIEWQEGEQELFWIYDDLHCPNPVSPLFFDIGGWWLTCDHMFRRFGTPFASDWVAKNINGYVYTAAIPADPSVQAEATEYEARYVPRVPRDGAYAGAIGAYLGFVLPHYAENFMAWWHRPPAPGDRAQLRLSRRPGLGRRVVRRAGDPARGRDRHPRPPLEDPLDAQLRPVLGDHGASTPRSRRSAARPTPGCSGACRARWPTATGTRSRTSGSSRRRSRATPSCAPPSTAARPRRR